MVDFDRTLFDTSRFFDKLWSCIAETYAIDLKIERERAKTFYRYTTENWYDYDFFTHIGSIDAISDDQVTFTARMHQSLGSIDFLFEDVMSLLPLIDAVVTFGNVPYQQFKLSFCPTLASLSIHIISEDKAKFIEREFGDQQVILVDDKHLEDDVSNTVRFIHLDRGQRLPIEEHGNYISINSLSSIPELIS